ncbi:hypothetical protein HDU80_003473 [Chytriomyces hyalinus]|nr:hypothetical protein HDU80_003473 [Chytriomyces hyalinus]
MMEGKSAQNKSKAGRKLAASEPLTRRAQLNRENQRKFRQRKEDHVANLERQNAEFHEIMAAKNNEIVGLHSTISLLQSRVDSLTQVVSQLEAANSVLSNQQQQQYVSVNDRNPCPTCAMERAKALFSDGKVKALSLKLAAAETEIENMKALNATIQSQQPYTLPHSLDFLLASPPLANEAINTATSGLLPPINTPQTVFPEPNNSNLDFSFALRNAPNAPNASQSTLDAPLSVSASPNESTGDEWMDVFMNSNNILTPQEVLFKQTVPSAESLYGPMRVEFARYTMKTIPALKSSNLVDEWIDALVSQTRATTRLKMKRTSIRAVTSWLKVLNHCTRDPRHFELASEIYFGCLDLNPYHMDYVLQVMDEADPPYAYKSGKQPFPERAVSLRDGLLSIPSLSTSVDAIEELCVTFLAPSFAPSDFAHTGRLIRAMQKRCATYQEKSQLLTQMFQFNAKIKDLSAKKFEDAIRDLDKFEIHFCISISPNPSNQPPIYHCTPTSTLLCSEMDRPSPDDESSNSGRNAKKVGRKRDDTVPANKRIALNRENQRNYRERQMMRVASLEAKANETAELLTARNAEICTLRQKVAELQRRLMEAGSTSPNPTAELAECSMCAIKDASIASLKDELNAQRLQTGMGGGDQFQLVFQAQQTVSFMNAAPPTLAADPLPFLFTNPTTTAATTTTAPAEDGMESPLTANTASSTSTEKRITALQSSPPISLTTSDPSFGDEWYDIMNQDPQHLSKTSEQLFGPIKVEFVRYSFKQVPSLADCKYVDLLIETIISSTRVTSKAKIKKCMIRMLNVWHKILDACKSNPVDMNQATEIFFAFQELNGEHLQYLMSVMVEGRMQQTLLGDSESETTGFGVREPGGAREIPPQALELCRALRRIPSLTDAWDLIDELCILFCSTRIRGESYVKTGNVISRLHRMCFGYQDRAEFLKQLMHFKESNKAMSDIKMENAMEEFDCLSI